jgi:hypothetical protein
MGPVTTARMLVRGLRNIALRGGPAFFGTLVVTDLCNLRCQHCAVRNPAGTLPSYEALHREMQAFRDEGVSVATNGTVDLDLPNVDLVLLSLDGTRATHDAIRGPTYDRILVNLERAPRRNICIYMAVNALNWREIRAVADFARGHQKISSISFNFHTPYRGTEALSLSEAQKRSAAGEIGRLMDDGYPVLNLKETLRAYLANDWARPFRYCHVSDLRRRYVCGRCIEEPGLCEKCGYLFAAEFGMLFDGQVLAAPRRQTAEPLQGLRPAELCASLPDNVGLYVHVPFCERLCRFCPYNRQVVEADLLARYVAALRREFELLAPALGHARLGADQVSVYPMMRFGYTPLGERKIHDEHREKMALREIARAGRRHGYFRSSVWTFNRPPVRRYTSITREHSVGLGPSGSSFLGRTFTVNTFDVPTYASLLESGRLPVTLRIPLDRYGAMAYYLFWRLYEGRLRPHRFAEIFGQRPERAFPGLLPLLRLMGALERNDDVYLLTDSGFDMYHTLERWVTYRFIEPLWAACRESPVPERLRL